MKKDNERKYILFDIIRTLKPSGRGELEITDVNLAYLNRGELMHSIMRGFWSDAGTRESLVRANNFIIDSPARFPFVEETLRRYDAELEERKRKQV